MKSRRWLWLATLWGLGAGLHVQAQDGEEAFVGPPLPDHLQGALIEGIVLNPTGGGIAEAQVRIESPDADASAAPLAEGLTNATGDIHVQLPGGTTGQVRIRISKEGYQEHVATIDIPQEDLPPFIDVLLPGAAKIHGQLRDRTTDQPIAGATIVCDNGGREISTVTDDAGTWRFENIYQGRVRLTVHADGYGIERADSMVERAEHTLELDAMPERPVHLAVVNNEGDPAPDVLIEAYVDPMQQYLTARTDENGEAALHGVNARAERIHLRLTGEGYVQQPAFDETIELRAPSTRPAQHAGHQDASGSQPAPIFDPVEKRLVILLAGGIRGKVVDAGSGDPVVGVRVIAGREVRYDMPMTWSAIDGTYELTGLPPGNNLITWQPSRHAPVMQEVYVEKGEVKEVDVELESGRPLGGIVVDAEGQPLDQVRVHAESWEGYTTLGMRLITGEEGRFAFPHAPEGRIEMTFVRPGYGPMLSRTLESGRTDYRIELEPEAAPLPKFEERKIPDGGAVPDLKLVATDGNTYELKKLRGKYVFLDFWASWCAPCIGEIPHIRAVHEATKDRADFVMLGVSLDNDRQAFRNATETHGLEWPQVFGPQSGAEDAFNTLDGVAIPYICLIGPDGTILAQHLRGPEMLDEVQKHLPPVKK